MRPRKLLRLKPEKVARRVTEYVLFALLWRGSGTVRPVVRLLLQPQVGETPRWRVRASVTNNCICRIYVLGVFLRKGGAFQLTAESRKEALSTSRPFGRSGVLTALSRPEALPVGRTLTDSFWIEPKELGSGALPTADDFAAMYRRHDDKERIHLQSAQVMFDRKKHQVQHIASSSKVD